MFYDYKLTPVKGNVVKSKNNCWNKIYNLENINKCLFSSCKNGQHDILCSTKVKPKLFINFDIFDKKDFYLKDKNGHELFINEHGIVFTLPVTLDGTSDEDFNFIKYSTKHIKNTIVNFILSSKNINFILFTDYPENIDSVFKQIPKNLKIYLDAHSIQRMNFRFKKGFVNE